jgi:hypothetical protein
MLIVLLGVVVGFVLLLGVAAAHGERRGDEWRRWHR